MKSTILRVMHYQPNRDYVSNDVVQTPIDLARRIVSHFKPQGKVLEPCRGQGNFYQHLPKGSFWCEIQEGKDFLDWKTPVDWIVTNPPWSQIRPFMAHAMKVSDNVVFLMTINHVWTKARIRDIQTAGFGIKEIALVEMPKDFPQSGFQLGAVHVCKGWGDQITLSDLSSKPGAKMPGKDLRKSRLKSPVSVVKGVSRNFL